MGNNPVILPEDDVSEAEWLCAAVAAGNFQVLAAAHREEESEQCQLVERDGDGCFERACDHLRDEAEWDRFLRLC